MANKSSNSFKYLLLRFFDITGFTVFDPIVRLIYGEEPQKQIKAILNFLVIPILFIMLCVSLWFFIAPKHKTKSGEVPTPDRVIDSYVTNKTFHEREQLKKKYFNLKGEARLNTLAEVEARIATLEVEANALQEEVNRIEKEYSDTILPEKVGDTQAKVDAMEAENRKKKSVRKAQIKELAKQVVEGNATDEALVTAMIQTDKENDAEKATLGELEAIIDDIRSDKFKPLEAARAKSNKVANELFFLRSARDILSNNNVAVKKAEMDEKLAEARADLAAATTAKEKESAAKKVVRALESIERLEGQQYPAAVTINKQIQRSLFTVIIGFFMAAMVAIPVGIMCGLNKIVMACLTPIISLFRPVSPVVWLLIFQIVVGAFFPNPDDHPLFNFLNTLPWIKDLGVNPALVFSACTVAMCAVWPALVNTALGVASIDPDYLNVAKVLRLGFMDRLIKIIIPSALPLVFAGLRISLGVGWMVLIAAEALSSSDGLGKFVWDEYQNGSSLTFANIIYACFVVGFIGFVLDRIMIIFQRLVSFDGGAGSV